MLLLLAFLSNLHGVAEAIVDLVSRGTTLREGKINEIEGGVTLEVSLSYT